MLVCYVQAYLKGSQKSLVDDLERAKRQGYVLGVKLVSGRGAGTLSSPGYRRVPNMSTSMAQLLPMIG